MNLYSEEIKLANEIGVPPNHVCIVGSTLICGHGNDVDFLCLVPTEEALEGVGFVADIEVSYESPLRSFRREGQNAIAVTYEGFFLAEVAIAHAARLIASGPFNMADRDERIRFHSEVRQHVLGRMAEGQI